jgi:ADP-ribose pyrophosphatase YjhB (NUDIX family)
MSLTIEEAETLVKLLGKMEWPLPPKVFSAIIGKIVSIPIELVVLDSANRVLMTYREDREYKGWHLPGTVLREPETVLGALERLKTGELRGTEISTPVNIGWVEIPKGDGRGENPTRHEISLVFVARLASKYCGQGKFFDIDNLPQALSHHYTLLDMVAAHLSLNP